MRASGIFWLTSLAFLLAGCEPLSEVETEAVTDSPVTETRELESQYHNLRLRTVVEGLEYPWAIAFLPDGRLLVSERPGRLNIIDDGEVIKVGGIPEDLHATNQGGLLDIALHPGYDDNGWIYLTYSQGDAEATRTTLIRGRLDGETLADVEKVFTEGRASGPGRHYGSRLAWLPDGTLLMSVGDRGAEPPRAQDTADHAGTLLRLNDDGSVPGDNPFVDDEDYLPEIYSYGHRNIQGLIVHPESGEIWASEHGPRGGDELNRVQAGNNYGWPQVTLGRDYRTEATFNGAVRSKEGKTDPVIDWTPEIAPSGLTYVPGKAFENWEGNLLAGGLRSRQIRRVVFEDGIVVHEEELIREEIGRIRDVRKGPNGGIYITTDESDGGVYKLTPVR